jgi:hypothetical protein
VFGEEVAQRLANQVWIERLPADDRDMIHHLVLVEDGSERFGAFGKSSQWRHFIEVFVLEAARPDPRLSTSRRTASASTSASRCGSARARPRAPFQLCLELTNKNGRSATYYSRHDWRIDGTSPEALAALGEAQPEIAPLLEDLAERPAAFDASEFVLADDFIE